MSRLVFAAVVCAGALSALWASPASAQFDQLAAKIPDAANLAVLLDAERLLDSPLAKTEGWKEKYEQQFAAGMVAIAPDTRRMILSAQYDFDYMNPQWKLAIADFRNERTLATIARQTKGTLDPVGDTQALVLRDDAYCVQFSPTRLAVMAPANRQSVARWLRQVGSRTAPALSPYLKGTLVASQTHQMVIAIDLEDAVPLDVIKGKLGTSSALSGKNINVDAAAKALAGIRGAVLEVAVTDNSTGRLMVHFNGDASVLAPIAKPLLMEVLGDMGARIDDIENWNVSAESQRFVFSGPLGKDGRKRVFSLIDTPTSALIATDTAALASKQSQSQSAGQAQATKKYFTTLTSLCDDLREKNNDAKTFGQYAMWLDNDARRIDRLPTLDVDDHMLAYGRYLSARLRDVSMALKGIGINTAAKSAQIYQTVTTDYNAYGNAWGGGYSYYTEWNNVDAERRAVRAQEKATGATAARQIAQEVQNETAKIRQEMTSKYRVNF